MSYLEKLLLFQIDYKHAEFNFLSKRIFSTSKAQYNSIKSPEKSKKVKKSPVIPGCSIKDVSIAVTPAYSRKINA
jgi:hypothetical protein